MFTKGEPAVLNHQSGQWPNAATDPVIPGSGDTQETNTVMEPCDTRKNPLGPETRRALGMRVRVWRPKEEEKQLCPSRCLRNCCSCSVAAPSSEGASGSFHLQHHKWVDRRRRSVVSDFAGNWVLNNFFVKEILLGFISGSEKSRLSERNLLVCVTRSQVTGWDQVEGLTKSSCGIKTW